MSTPILPLALWQAGTNQNSIPANDNALRLQILNGLVISKAVTAQPASPADGDIYILPATHTGSHWAGFDEDDLVIFKGGTWYAFAPADGISVNFAGSQQQFLAGSSGGWAASGAGAGSVTSVDASGGVEVVAGSPISSSGTIRSMSLINAQAGTSYTYVTADRGKLVTHSNASAIAGTLPQATTTFGSGWFMRVKNKGAGTLTITPTTSTIDGASTLVLTTGQCALIVSDGTNYQTAFVSTSGGGGGLTNITEGISTSSPNATVNVVSLAVTGGTTASGLALVPKGAGFLAAAVPDGTTAGGDTRGSRAVDWQLNRSNTNQVAAAAGATISGGSSNRIVSTNNNSVIAGGTGNTINGASGASNTIGGGTTNTLGATGGSNVISGGSTNSITGSAGAATVSGGSSNTTSGNGAVIAGGDHNTSAGNYSFTFGSNAAGKGVTGVFTHSSGVLVSAGDAQSERYVLSIRTLTSTPTALTSTQGAASTNNQPTLATGSAMTFTGTVVARNAITGDMAGWVISGSLKNFGGTVSLVGTPTVTQTGADSGASTWALTVAADNTNKALQITGTGASSTTIKWVATVDASYVV